MRSTFFLAGILNKWGFVDLMKPMTAINQRSAAISQDWGVASKKDNYAEARKKEVRARWARSMQEIADHIYKINKPVVHHFVIAEKK